MGRIWGRFEDLGRGFSTTRPLRFCVPRRLGFWGCEQEIAATKTRKTIFCPCSLQRPQQQNVDLLVFVAALSLWLSFPGSLNMARRNARSDPPPHRRWCEACWTQKSSSANSASSSSSQKLLPKNLAQEASDPFLFLSPAGRTFRKAGPKSLATSSKMDAFLIIWAPKTLFEICFPKTSKYFDLINWR